MQQLATGTAFVEGQIQLIHAFCSELDQKLPAYSYVPLTTDAQRVLVMQSRLYNELRAGEVFGGWLATTPEMEVKQLLAEACNEEFVHAQLLTERISGMGVEPLDYGPPPEQVALFHTMHRLEHTVERLAAFQLAGEIVASHLIRCALESPTVPEWIKAPYRRIIEDEDQHGLGPVALVGRYAASADAQRLVRRSVRLGLELRRHYFAALDAMAYEDVRW